MEGYEIEVPIDGSIEIITKLNKIVIRIKYDNIHVDDFKHISESSRSPRSPVRSPRHTRSYVQTKLPLVSRLPVRSRSPRNRSYQVSRLPSIPSVSSIPSVIPSRLSLVPVSPRLLQNQDRHYEDYIQSSEYIRQHVSVPVFEVPGLKSPNTKLVVKYNPLNSRKNIYDILVLLEDIFEKYGKIESINTTDTPDIYTAIITYKDSRDASDAKHELNNNDYLFDGVITIE